MSAETYSSEILERYLKAVKKAAGEEAMDLEAARLADPKEFGAWWSARSQRVSFMDVTSATNERTLIATVNPMMPSGNKVPLLVLNRPIQSRLCGFLNSFAFDYVMRRRLGGLSVNYFVLDEAPLPRQSSDVFSEAHVRRWIDSLCMGNQVFAGMWCGDDLSVRRNAWRSHWALLGAERLRARCILDALATMALGLDAATLSEVLKECGEAEPPIGADPKGFWRVDKEQEPQLRQTVLSLAAFRDLEQKVEASNGNHESGVRAFLSQNGERGWMLPQALRLADVGFEGAESAQALVPVAERLGSLFLDWQLAQTAEESWRECEIHARNLTASTAPPAPTPSSAPATANPKASSLFQRDGDE
jgi:hypothetical protein